MQNKKASRVRSETQLMAKKCVKKLILMVMMEYLIIGLVVVFTVQANDELTTSFSLCTSSHPIRLLHPYECVIIAHAEESLHMIASKLDLDIP